MRKHRPIQSQIVGFIALGCPKNMVDSETMLARIGQAGFILSDDPFCADAVVINTCGFIAPAKEEAMDVIQQALEHKKLGNLRKVVAAGCLSERMGADLLKEAPGLDAVVGLGQRDQIADILQDVLNRNHSERLFMAPSGTVIHSDSTRLLISPRHWAYLRISEGCSRRCSFCTIPSIRGPYRSKPLDAVVREAKQLVRHGAVELSLIAQDSNAYGRDLGMNNGLQTLVEQLTEIRRLQWIRLMYLYPSAIDDSLIQCIADHPKVVPYIDMPVQHIHDPILKAMKRTDTRDKIVRVIEKLRSVIPEVVLRTTVIVGFPGETSEAFQELMDFVQWAKFDALGAFPFYPEPGTGAAELPNPVDAETKQQRLDELMTAQQHIAFDKADGLKGRQLTVLVDTRTGEQSAEGRYYGQAPHIDSICLIDDCRADEGQLIEVGVTGRQDYDLICEQISQ